MRDTYIIDPRFKDNSLQSSVVVTNSPRAHCRNSPGRASLLHEGLLTHIFDRRGQMSETVTEGLGAYSFDAASLPFSGLGS